MCISEEAKKCNVVFRSNNKKKKVKAKDPEKETEPISTLCDTMKKQIINRSVGKNKISFKTFFRLVTSHALFTANNRFCARFVECTRSLFYKGQCEILISMALKKPSNFYINWSLSGP